MNKSIHMLSKHNKPNEEKLSWEAIEKKVEKLIKNDESILECIKFVKFNQKISLKEAHEFVASFKAHLDSERE